LIFDLKGNGGGLLDQAQKIADEFLSDKKLVVYSEGRAQPRSDLETYRNGLWEKGSLVVLTDEYSASASEIVSGAIQDWDRGLIVGRRTFGKGLVQRPIDLSDGSQMRLTIARYYTPSGRFIQKPYDDDVDSYRKDLKNRYLNGELQHLDSIKLPDSLKFQTLLTKRTVYGGGGILPDIFVPLDTTEITDYFRSLVQTGLMNNFTMDYIEKNRDGLKSSYSSFESFNRDFKVDEAFMKTFFAYVTKEDPKLTFNEKEYATSAKLIHLRIKAQIAQNAFGINEFYQVFNESDEIIQRAVQALTTKEYSKAKLKN
jgi:carboxyl-terminal processing protease